jgi:hypothetical protein
MAIYKHIKRAKKGRFINTVCALYVKPVENVLVLLTTTRMTDLTIAVNVIAVLEAVPQVNLDGHS